MNTDSWVGRDIGDYRLVDLIGSDPSGVSYRATQLSRSRTVALKLIGSPLADRASFRERFAGEMDLLRSIHHSHVVTTYEAGEAEDVIYVATRYLPATDLEALLGGTDPIGYLNAVEIISQVAEGLEFAHSQGLVHRGLTPRSILVLATDEGDHAYLGDFGITEDTVAFGGVLGAPDDGSRPLFDYVSPEQIRGEPADARTDVYGLACVLFEAITGLPPFERYYGADKLEAHLSVPPPSVKTVNPELPDALDELFATALAEDPDQRFSSVLEMAHALPTKRRVLTRWRAMLEAGSMAPGAQVPATVGAMEAAGAGGPSAMAGASGPDPSEGEFAPAGDFASPGSDPEMSTGGSSGGSGSKGPGSGGSGSKGPGSGKDGSNGPGDDEPNGPGDDDEGDATAEKPDTREADDDSGWEKSSWSAPVVALAAVFVLGASAVGVLALSGTFSDDPEEKTASSEPAGAAGPPVVDEEVVPGAEEEATAQKQKPEGRKDGGSGEGTAQGSGAGEPEKKPSRGGAKGEIGSWPSGTTGYTAIAFASTSDRAGAEAAAREAAKLGLRSGVLSSGDYGSLQPGSWVAFAGIYDSQAEAEDAVDQLRQAGVAAAPYVRYIGGG